MNYRQLIEILRQQYGYRCGYCGVTEYEVGSLLEVDHFCPVSAGGTNELDNLVYCCTACNRNKGDFWSVSESERLLHPLHDNLSDHLQEQENGLLIPLTDRGALHIERLRLNRPALVALRLRRQRELRLSKEIHDVEYEINQIIESVISEEDSIFSYKEQIVHLLEHIIDLLRSWQR